MSRTRFFTGPVCGIGGCKAKRYYKSDGQVFCKNNHNVEGVIDYEIDEDEAFAAGVGNRRRLAGVEQRTAQKASQIERGKAGYGLFLQAMQLILRHQVVFLESFYDVKLETLIKDLWIAFLIAQEANDALPEVEPISQADNQEGQPDREDEAVVGDESSTSSASDKEGEEAKYYQSARYTMSRVVLLHSIALCYIALLLIRIPITIAQLHGWLQSMQLPYLNVIRLIPEAISSQLDPGYRAALQPRQIPGTMRLWKWIQHTATFLNIQRRIIVPALNYRPIVYLMISESYLPINFLNRLVDLIESSQYHMILVNEEKYNSMSICAPEVRLACLLFVLVKLESNLVQNRAKPADTIPNISAWSQSIESSLASEVNHEPLSRISIREVLKMDEQACEEYLYSFADTWLLPGESNPRLPSGMVDLFPLVKPSLSEQKDVYTHDSTSDINRRLYAMPRVLANKKGQPDIYCPMQIDLPEELTPIDLLAKALAKFCKITNSEMRRLIQRLETQLLVIRPNT